MRAGIAVDSAGNFYVNVGNNVKQFDSSGVATGFTFDAGLISQTEGLAVDSAGKIYAVDQAGNIGKYGPKSNFTLDVDQDATYEHQITLSDVAPGSYDISETVPAHWRLGSAGLCGRQRPPAL